MHWGEGTLADLMPSDVGAEDGMDHLGLRVSVRVCLFVYVK